jgi:hypothetical protein
MTEKEGTLRMMASGRWAVYRPGRLPVEPSGDLFRVEVAGATALQITRLDTITPQSHDHALYANGHQLKNSRHASQFPPRLPDKILFVASFFLDGLGWFDRLSEAVLRKATSLN